MKQHSVIGAWPQLAGLFFWVVTQAGACEHPVARLVALQGEAEEQVHNTVRWQPSAPAHDFCAGDRIRTREHSRATLELNNKTYLSLEQKTTIVFSGLKPREPSWLELIKGVIYLRSRTPSSLDIKTPFVNAAIKGTEFLVETDDSHGRVSVLEGRVEASNPRGRVMLTEGQSAVARADAAPVAKLLIAPRDAVRWALYYPPLLDAASLRQISPTAGQLYLDGKAAGALAALEAADAPIAKAALLLELGRADEATALLDALPADGPRQGEILPLLSVIALARNDKARARELAEQATIRLAQAPAAWMALSYVRQAEFRLDEALASARKAAELAPENARALAHLAELTAATGRHAEARELTSRAVTLNPRLARAWVLRGFAELNEEAAAQAETTLAVALRLDSADPLAHFGLGLAKIRQGRLEEGTGELEIAASLDPSDALSRSYLGKAYYEQKNGKVAATELEIAKQLDPQDPTPYFYDAIKKHTENRPVEALHDLQRAIALNGNRAVYRSKQMLDSDLAARGATIGRIYNELGFSPRATVEAWSALADDPADYSSHRLLSDAYSALPRHDLARSSELLQSQLLQPINITPVQPRLAENNLFLIGNQGPSALSLNEFNPLFERDRFSLLVSGLVGSHDTYSDEVVHSGLWKDWSYSLGQFHYQTQGFHKNNAIDANLYNAFVQGRITPDFSVQAEYRHRDQTFGNLTSRFFPLPAELQAYVQPYMDNTYQQTSTDTYRLGFNLAATERSKLLGSFIHMEQSAPTIQKAYTLYPPDSAPIPVEAYRQEFFARGSQGEVQHLYARDWFKSILGGGFGQVDFNTAGQIFQRQQQGNGYFYTDIHFPSAAKWTLGATVDVLDDSENAQTDRTFNPKVGVMWNLTPDTVLRAAAIKSKKRFLFSGQTLEPTQVAGFNQFFDDQNQTRATRYGVGLDQRINTDLAGGVELSERQLDVPIEGLGDNHWRETLYRGYLLWTPHPRWAASLEYYREDFSNLEWRTLTGATNTSTQYIPVSLSYFDPSGWYARFKATHYRQDAKRFDGWTGNELESHDNAAFLDLGLGYRLPRRLGLFEVQFQNLLDQHYRYEALGVRSSSNNLTGGIPPYLPFPPEFTVSARITLAF